jgi:S1-C subfamily serine protease
MGTMIEFVTLTNRDVITEHAVQLVAFRDDHYDPMGSAIQLRPNLLLTARHVVDDYFAKLDGRVFETGMEARFGCWAIQELTDGRIFRLAIKKVWAAPWSDLALLSVESTSDRKPLLVRMNMSPPPVGTKVFAFGYHDCSVKIDGDTVTLARKGSTSVGTVIEIHDQRRDNFSITWPCFRVDARFDRGMSGGPVFNETGQLCGLVCACMPPAAPGASYNSYVTSLWPMLAIEMDFAREGHPPGLYTVQELAGDGMIAALDAERVVLHRDADGKVTGVEYRH